MRLFLICAHCLVREEHGEVYVCYVTGRDIFTYKSFREYIHGLQFSAFYIKKLTMSILCNIAYMI
jgi:hypothetical protein